MVVSLEGQEHGILEALANVISDGYEIERVESLLPVVSIQDAEERFLIADDVVIDKVIVESIFFD